MNITVTKESFNNQGYIKSTKPFIVLYYDFLDLLDITTISFNMSEDIIKPICFTLRGNTLRGAA